MKCSRTRSGSIWGKTLCLKHHIHFVLSFLKLIRFSCQRGGFLWGTIRTVHLFSNLIHPPEQIKNLQSFKICYLYIVSCLRLNRDRKTCCWEWVWGCFFFALFLRACYLSVVSWLTDVRSTGNSPDSPTWPVRSRTWGTQSRSGTSGFSLDWTRWNSCPMTSSCPTPVNPDRTTSPSLINSAMRYHPHVYTGGSRRPKHETQASKYKVGDFMHKEEHMFCCKLEENSGWWLKETNNSIQMSPNPPAWPVFDIRCRSCRLLKHCHDPSASLLSIFSSAKQQVFKSKVLLWPRCEINLHVSLLRRDNPPARCC